MVDPQFATFINALNNPVYAVVFGALAVWALVWKGVALWKAARNTQKKWFVVMLIFNTFGILEIAYIFWFQKKPLANEEAKQS